MNTNNTTCRGRGGRVKGLYGLLSEVDEAAVGRTVYIASGEDRARAELAGVEAVRTGTFTSIRPVMSKADMSSFRFGSMPVATGHEDMFYPFLQPGSQAWEAYMSTRKVVELRDGGGPVRLTVTNNMAEKLTSVDSGGGVKRVFRLTQLLTDPQLHEKFGLSLDVVHSMRTLAIARPDAAARQLTELLNKVRPGFGYVVSADGYSTTKRRAKDAVAEFCGRYTPVSVTVDCTVIGGDVFAYGPGKGVGSWAVSGPMEFTAEVIMVHRAVEYCGPTSVMFALGSEFTLLKLDIAVDGRYISPVMERHVGTPGSSLPYESSTVTSALLTLEAKMAIDALRSSLVEVTAAGELVATAVRVSSKYALVSTHVAEVGDVLVDGEALQQARALSSDLWTTRLDRLAVTAWPLREARSGERVIVCYRGPSGGVQYTSPMSVLSVGSESMSMSRLDELTKGMSGGAVVALDDMALLGVYEGVGRQQAIALVFTPAMFATVHQVSEVSIASRPGGSDAVLKLKDKGLAKYVQGVFDAVSPLYAGDIHVGHAFGFSGGTLTVCDPDAAALSLDPKGQPMVFDRHSFCLYESRHASLPTPMLMRAPGYFESVVIVGRDGDGPYYSSVSRVVHIGVGGANFSLESVETDPVLPYTGGLVMSLADAAVLGVFVKQSASPSLGLVQFCVGFPRGGDYSDDKLRRASLVVQSKFPMLHVGSWPSGVIEEVVTHASMQKYTVSKRPFNSGMAPLAFLGDAILRARFAERARDVSMPHGQWQLTVQRTQSNAALAALAKRLELDALVQFGLGTSPPPPGAKAYADLVEALVGAVHLYEAGEVVAQFVDAVFVGLGVEFSSVSLVNPVGVSGDPLTLPV